MTNTKGNVIVVSRFRPLNRLELSKDGTVCVETSKDQKSVTLHMPNENKDFSFDHVFPLSSKQPEVYNVCAQEILDGVFNGINGTILAYGQTSSGKTHTMMGPDNSTEKTTGIIPRLAHSIFERVASMNSEFDSTIRVSFVEIYQERIRDLIDNKRTNLDIRESKEKGIYIDGVSERLCEDYPGFMKWLKIGEGNRKTASTGMNERSSRSHSVLMIRLEQKSFATESIKTSRLYLVDLAGSEKVRQTGAEGRQLEEAKKINWSLSALGNVINSLTDGKSTHIPYRDSKLTRILQETFGGNSRTVLIVCASGSSTNAQETLSTLRFGERAKKVRNSVTVNEEKSPQELKRMLERAEEELRILRLELSTQRDGRKSDGAAGEEEGKSEENELLRAEINRLREENLNLEQAREREENEKNRLQDEVVNKESELRGKEEEREEEERRRMELEAEKGSLLTQIYEMKKERTDLDREIIGWKEEGRRFGVREKELELSVKVLEERVMWMESEEKRKAEEKEKKEKEGPAGIEDSEIGIEIRRDTDTKIIDGMDHFLGLGLNESVARLHSSQMMITSSPQKRKMEIGMERGEEREWSEMEGEEMKRREDERRQIEKYSIVELREIVAGLVMEKREREKDDKRKEEERREIDAKSADERLKEDERKEKEREREERIKKEEETLKMEIQELQHQNSLLQYQISQEQQRLSQFVVATTQTDTSLSPSLSKSENEEEHSQRAEIDQNRESVVIGTQTEAHLASSLSQSQAEEERANRAELEALRESVIAAEERSDELTFVLDGMKEENKEIRTKMKRIASVMKEREEQWRKEHAQQRAHIRRLEDTLLATQEELVLNVNAVEAKEREMKEREAIYQSDIAERCNKVMQLEMTLDSSREAIDLLTESNELLQQTGKKIERKKRLSEKELFEVEMIGVMNRLKKRIGRLEMSLGQLSGVHVEVCRLNGCLRKEVWLWEEKEKVNQTKLEAMEERLKEIVGREKTLALEWDSQKAELEKRVSVLCDGLVSGREWWEVFDELSLLTSDTIVPNVGNVNNGRDSVGMDGSEEESGRDGNTNGGEEGGSGREDRQKKERDGGRREKEEEWRTKTHRRDEKIGSFTEAMFAMAETMNSHRNPKSVKTEPEEIDSEKEAEIDRWVGASSLESSP
ncbi:putative Kinesin heavy chain [Blattamonas nauphoetae]|uniref:Kinesin heavy chain n=1 Tax=Blattamonas nauphoetae TaxID=2049346 RepID=A0ABQ9XDL5_9EUKA|nr:putative Kinesin heavy chain [Blattamonas nauphoetae]